MELFVKVMNVVNDIVWHPVMCVFLMFAALWFTFHLRGMQVRRFGDMLKCLTEKGDNKQDTGLSSFQAFEILQERQLQFLWGDLVPFSGCGLLQF